MTTHQNPFSSRFIKPGAIPFRPGGELDVSDLVEKLATQNWRGEIIGPHGCGKSTLLATLKSQLPMDCMQVTLQASQSADENWQTVDEMLGRLKNGDLLIVDGVEQLSSRHVKSLSDSTLANRTGLIVTSHHPVGLPALIELKPDIDRFRNMVENLLAGSETQLTQQEIDYAFNKYTPNVREALFSLYDVYEIKRRKSDK